MKNIKVEMRNLVKSLAFALAFGGALWANEEVAHEEQHDVETTTEEKEFDPTEMIMHHIGDAHGFHIYGEGHDAVSFPLPVILWTESGLVTFSSSAFHHDTEGQVVVEKDGMKFVNLHEHIYQINGDHLEMNHETHEVENAITPLDFSITKNVFSMLLSVVIIMALFMSVARSYKKRGVTSTTKGLQSFLEPLVVFVRDDIAKPNIASSKVNKFLPYLLTVFFFIWVNNLLGLIPIFPGSANLTGNIAVTLTLSVFTMLMTNLNGNKHYWAHIFWTPGVPWWLKAPVPLMPLVELVGVLAKPFALMVRLFANITAGHIIILALMSLIFIFKSEAWAGLSVPLALFISVLELLVAALQAYVFTLLSALFIGMAVDDHH